MIWQMISEHFKCFEGTFYKLKQNDEYLFNF